MKNRKQFARTGSNTSSHRPEIRRRRLFEVQSLERRVLLDGNLFVSDATPPDTATPNTPAGTIGEYTTTGTKVSAPLVSGLTAPDGICVSGSVVLWGSKPDSSRKFRLRQASRSTVVLCYCLPIAALRRSLSSCA